MIRKNYYIPEPLLERLAAEAARTGLTEAEIVRRAIEEYLRRQERRG